MQLAENSVKFHIRLIFLQVYDMMILLGANRRFRLAPVLCKACHPGQAKRIEGSSHFVCA